LIRAEGWNRIAGRPEGVLAGVGNIQHAEIWLREYIDSFRSGEGTLHPLIEVKRVHSIRVRDNGSRIADELGWEGVLRDTAVAACLLHDTGRFPQFREYGTYYDGASVDHGNLGEKVLREKFPWEVLEGIGVKEIILEAVRLHNKKILPDTLPESVVPVARIVRDSDKIDVFRLVRRHVEEGRIHDLLPRIEIRNEYSYGLLKELAEEGSGSYRNVTTLADFLLVQLSWAFDLNYRPSFRILEEDGVFSWIAGHLPYHRDADPFVSAALEYAR